MAQPASGGLEVVGHEVVNSEQEVSAAGDEGPWELADCVSEYTFRTPQGEDPSTWVRVRQTDSRSGWIISRGIEVWDGNGWSGIIGHPQPRRLVHPLSLAIGVARQTIRAGQGLQT